MRIEFDYDFDPVGQICGRHYIETAPGAYQQVSHAALGPGAVDVIHLLKALHDGALPIAGTGWDEVAKHPDYPGQTRLQACIAEIVRLDDKPARTILGV